MIGPCSSGNNPLSVWGLEKHGGFLSDLVRTSSSRLIKKSRLKGGIIKNDTNPCNILFSLKT